MPDIRGLVWIVVGILAIIALIVYLTQHVHTSP